MSTPQHVNVALRLVRKDFGECVLSSHTRAKSDWGVDFLTAKKAIIRFVSNVLEQQACFQFIRDKCMLPVPEILRVYDQSIPDHPFMLLRRPDGDRLEELGNLSKTQMQKFWAEYFNGMKQLSKVTFDILGNVQVNSHGEASIVPFPDIKQDNSMKAYLDELDPSLSLSSSNTRRLLWAMAETIPSDVLATKDFNLSPAYVSAHDIWYDKTCITCFDCWGELESLSPQFGWARCPDIIVVGRDFKLADYHAALREYSISNQLDFDHILGFLLWGLRNGNPAEEVRSALNLLDIPIKLVSIESGHASVLEETLERVKERLPQYWRDQISHHAVGIKRTE